MNLLGKFKNNVIPIVGISSLIYYGIQTYRNTPYVNKQELDNILNDVYYGKNHRWAIVTQPSIHSNRYTFSQYSGLLIRESDYFDNSKINKSIDDYVSGKYYDYSSMETTKIKNFADFAGSITKYNFPYIRIIVNENDCPIPIQNNESRIISTYSFLDEAMYSHVADTNPRCFMHSIDLRNCQDINSQELENLINQSQDNVKVLVTNQKKAGKDMTEKFKQKYDKIIFVGKFDTNIVANMQNVFGTEYVTHMNKDMDNVIDKLYEHNPKLFIEKITPADTIDKITDEHTYGKVAFVSADTDFGNRLPIASGGNYMLNIYSYDMNDKKYIEIINKFVDTLVKNDVKSVVFTCCHSNTRGPYLASLFKEICREKYTDFNIYVMHPGVCRVHDPKYNNAKTTRCTSLD